MKKYKLINYIEELKKENLLLEENISKELSEIIINNVTYDSRKVTENTIFICKGLSFKIEYLENALNSGAIAYVSEEQYKIQDKPFIIVNDIRKALAVLSKFYNNNPQNEINMIGITGTKGKSTTSYYIKYILDDYMKDLNKKETAIISSIDIFDGKAREGATMTTPEPEELFMHIRNAVNANLDNLVMEVCSQALKMERVYGILYKYGVFLNISEDHISNIEHKDYNDYLESKLKLFERAETAIVNLNTDDLDRVLKAAQKSKKIITFGNKENADVYGYNIRKEGLNTVFNVRTKSFDEEILLTMPGLFNVENALAAISVATEMGIPYENIYNGLKKAKATGRMEIYSNKNQDIVVIVDYAHNKLSFQKLYESTMKEYPKREIITVFGCPGNKAQNRRKDLGELSGKYSDMNYLTTDDPKYEDPKEICKEISTYIEKENGKYKIVIDREQAIKEAIFEAKPNSVILINGKGHETAQVIKGKREKYLSDAKCAKKYLKEIDNKSN